MYDVLLKEAKLIDPKNKINKIMDIAIKSGKIAQVNERINTDYASKVFNLSKKIVVPGIIDPHVHLSNWIGGSEGYKMMARVGVITAVDFAGPIDDIIGTINKKGSGLNIAGLNALRPGINLSGNNPSYKEIEQFIDNSLKKGAIGIKIMGGHYPLTPRATANVIKIANRKKVYIAFHVGTTENGSNLNGFKEAISLSEDYSIHFAHINSYCRGIIKEPLEELKEIFSLTQNRNGIVSESYLSCKNGSIGKCANGIPEDDITKSCLRMGGYHVTKTGLYQAIIDGFAEVIVSINGENVLIKGIIGAQYWLNANTDTLVSFTANIPEVLFLCAVHKNFSKKFLVDAFCTDGGGIPRNMIVEKGLQLIKFGAITWEDFIIKSSLMPSKMFGWLNKGHLTVGADADITVLDPEKCKAIMGINNGKVIMIEGMVIGEKGRILTTAQGERNVKESNIDYEIFDLNNCLFYKNNNKKR
ncbi:MAG: amidohydrolase [Candidatus Caldatribacteriota bacterium]|nr:amidohydrolase [Candidatus Caldatribacteriota bacterium]